MKFTRSYFVALLIAIQAFLIVSCETQPQSIDTNAKNTNQTLKLNFHDNVTAVNPLNVNNRAEQFIIDLVYDKFFEADGSSSLFQNFTFDSLQQLHIFELKANLQFHDGSPVDSKAVHDFFKYLIQHHIQNQFVNSLFTSMEGYASVYRYQENRNMLDSIRSGFQIINETTFSIRLRKNQHQIMNWLQGPIFTLFKLKQDAYIGCGSFELQNLDEDISAKLIRTSETDQMIKNINISFLKNNDLVYSEFFRGSLDLIYYNPYNQKETEPTQKLNKILEAKYAQFKIKQTNRSIIKYLEIHQVEDSTLLENILGSISIFGNGSVFNRKANNYSKPIEISNPIEPNSIDSSKYEIKYYSSNTSDAQNYFNNSHSINFVWSNIKNLNPTEPHIVIKEKTMEFHWSQEQNSLFKQLNEKLKQDDYSALAILDVYPEYVIFSNSLKGISDNKRLSEMVERAYFEKAKTY